MRRQALEVLACPACEGPLRELGSDSEPMESGKIGCPAGHTYPVEGGVPLLVPTEDGPRLAAFADSYARVWAREGWGSPDAEYLRNLPYRDVTGRRRTEWAVKARSTDALLPALDAGRALRIADLGCGMGWLAHRLALRGHEVYAVDATLDAAVGLGAAATYVRLGPTFTRVQGELERPPFLPASLDAVICNASLHYAAALEPALARISRALRPGGCLVILNSPVHRDAASAARGQSDFRRHLVASGAAEEVASRYHHFVRSELEAAVAAAVGPVREVPFDPGIGFRGSRRLKGLLLRMELASFPILLARKPAGLSAPPIDPAGAPGDPMGPRSTGANTHE